jgi:hypothetical protein
MYKQVICNLKNISITEWDLPMISCCTFNDRLILCTTDGLALYIGDKDNNNNIDAYYSFNLSSLANNQLKSLHDFYVYCITGGDVNIEISTDDEVLGSYIESDGVLNNHVIKVSVGKGHKGVNWFFRIKNVNGCFFDIERVLINFLIASRKVFSKTTHIQRHR